MNDVIIVGAGVSGLALARELQSQGLRPVVLERARGAGGRCATRRLDVQPVDHGIAYLHGRSQQFLAEMDAVEDVGVLTDWPRLRDGDGSPCRPEAFDMGERRVAFAGGVNRFAKHLARGIDVGLEANVVAMPAVPAFHASEAGWDMTLASGEVMRARAVTLTMPALQPSPCCRPRPRCPQLLPTCCRSSGSSVPSLA